MLPESQRLIVLVWIAGGAVWAVGALSAKRATRREPAAARVLHLAIMALAYGLVFKTALRPGPLHAFFIAPSPVTEWVGFGITVAGVGIAVLSRAFLGRNWSATVTVKVDHQLIRSGPYAVVRHPIYSGLALALFGTAVYYARVGCLLGVALAVFGWRLKSFTEEAFMEREFGAEYTEYKRQVRALIPLVW